MGEDKALVEIAERPMVSWVADALEDVCPRRVIAGRAVNLGGLVAIPDASEPHRGPLAGLVAALGDGPETAVVLVAVDQPWVQARTVQALVERFTGVPVVPIDEGIPQTTCAVYPKALLPAATDVFERGGSIRRLLEVVEFDAVGPETWATWGEDGRSWFSVDTPEAAVEGRRRFGAPGAR